jgi:sugar phosphate isomerase/epimerase
MSINRREFILKSSRASLGFLAAGALLPNCSVTKPGSRMKFGLVTYLWAKDWDLPTLLDNCEHSGTLGVELRTQHAHGVEVNLSKAQRTDVKKKFENTPVTFVGLGMNWAFHYVDQSRLKEQINGAKDSIVLSHDVGGSGVKVKPNSLPDEVPPEKTIEQIGLSLNEIGEFAHDYGQKIRVEVHGKRTSELPVMKAIFDHVTAPNVFICWNCNKQDLDGKGLEYNFNLIKDRFGDTVHIRELDIGDYPYQKLMELFVKMDYDGWIMLEARTDPEDKVRALIEQKNIFDKMLKKAQRI